MSKYVGAGKLFADADAFEAFILASLEHLLAWAAKDPAMSQQVGGGAQLDAKDRHERIHQARIAVGDVPEA